MGKIFIIIGIIFILFGAVLLLADKLHFPGRIPGDIYIQRKNFTFYFPLATSLLLSLLISFILWLWPKK